MGFGRRWSTSKLRNPVSLSCLLLSLLFYSCAFGPSTFVEARQTLDSRLAKAASIRSRDKAFSDAIRLAKTSTEWLSLLKRAELSERIAPAVGASVPDSGRQAKVAAAAAAAIPASADVRAACVRAYLRSRPADAATAGAATAVAATAAQALALFGPILKPEARPELWAEAFLAVYRGGKGNQTALAAQWEKPEYFGLLARTVGEPVFYIDAAALSLAAGDRFAARGWLGLAVKGGAVPPDELLWGAGLYEELAGRDDSGASPRRLRLLGDAASLSGQPEIAKRRWLRALETDPRASWKTYSSLAALSPEPESGAYYERMRSSFPESLGALSVYASYLARKGEAQRGLALLDSGLADASPKSGGTASHAKKGKAPKAAVSASPASEEELSFAQRARLIIGARVWPEERLVAQSLLAVESRPDDGKLLSLVLESLLERKRYEDFIALEKMKEKSGRGYPEDWYYESAALLLEGKQGAAAALLEEKGAGEEGPAAAFALGRVYSLQREWSKAATAYARALASARDKGERCAALKGLGRAKDGSGDASGARSLYLAALEADPSDLEAGLLAKSDLKR
jgi:tetratricopeptide (TPR) repeat protein